MITAERYEGRLGQTVRVLVDRVDDDTIQARGRFQADDIDGVTYVSGAKGIMPGTFADVRLDEVVEDVDFAASLVSIISSPQQPARRVRTLRVLESVGSYGR